MTVGFDNASHHTGEVTGLGVIERGFGNGSRDRGDNIVGIIIDSSLLGGVAVPRILLGRGGARAGLRGLGLASIGGDWGGGRSIAIGIILVCRVIVGLIDGGIVVVGARRGSELGNSGTGELVGGVGEGVDADAGVVVLVGTRESDEFVGTGGSGFVTADVDLDAAGVELGTSGLVTQMKSDNLVTEEIATTSEVGRKLEGVSLSVELILLNPSTVALADFVNLEPLSVRGIELVA